MIFVLTCISLCYGIPLLISSNQRFEKVPLRYSSTLLPQDRHVVATTLGRVITGRTSVSFFFSPLVYIIAIIARRL
ncbi:hypothetical protein F5X99DRAFT_379718, partial [Biscogniauxia marginata]